MEEVMDSVKVMTIDSQQILSNRNKSRSALEEEKRLRQRRKKWLIEQEHQKKHEERKLKMIKEYEKRRAQMKIDHKQRSRQSKSSSPQQRKITSTCYKYPEELRTSSTFKSTENTIIDKKEIHKIKIKITNQKNFPREDQNTSETKIERDIINPDDIILPRRESEGSCSIFEKVKMTAAQAEETREIREVKFLENNQLEKQLPTSKNSVSRRNPERNLITPCYRS